MPRKNKRKYTKKREYRRSLPDIVVENTQKPSPPKKELKIAPPPLAIPDTDTYGSAIPEFPEAMAADAIAKDTLLSPTAQSGKVAVAFVDYEHWFYSMWTEFGIRPNIGEWFGFISENQLLDIRFYADFSKDEIFKELPHIRSFTNTVIDTRSPNTKVEKDYSDFIILNDLYRMVLRHGAIEKVILLTGDGHFAPAASFLRTVCGIEVEAYGVKACINTSLRLSASIMHELPGSLDYLLPCSRDILVYMDKVRKKASWYQFCFMSLAEQVSNCYGHAFQTVKDAMETLLRQGYLYQEARYINGQEKNILDADWDAVDKGGMTPPEVRYASTELVKSSRPAAKRKTETAQPVVALYVNDGDDDEDADPTDAFIKAQMDEVDRQSSNNAENFMKQYRNAVI